MRLLYIRLTLFFLLSVLLTGQLFAQKKGHARVDSLMLRLPAMPEDSTKSILLNLIAYNNLGVNPNESIKYALKTIEFARKINYQQGVLVGNANLANAYRVTNRPASAVIYYQIAYDFAVKLKNVDLQNRMLLYLGLTHLILAHTDAAIEYGNKALIYYKKTNNTANIATINSYLAFAASLKGDAASALQILLNNLKEFKEIDTAQRHLTQLTQIADCYISLSDFPRALDYLQGSLKLISAKDYAMLMSVNMQISRVYNQLGETPVALQYDLKALTNFTSIGQESAETHSQILSDFAEDYNTVGDYDKSITYSQQALSLIKLSDNAFTAALKIDIYNRIAQSYYKKRNFGAALLYAQKGMAEKTDLKNAYTPVETVLGEIYCSAVDSTLSKNGIKPAEKYKKAIAYFSDALNSASLQQDLPALRDIYKDLSQAYEKTNEYQKAYETHKKYIVFRDSTTKLNNKNEITRRDAKLVYDKKEDSIHYQQRITEEQLKQQKQLGLIGEQKLTIANNEKNLQRANVLKTQSDLLAEHNKREANLLQLRSSQQEGVIQKGEIQKRQTQTYYLFAGIGALLILSFFIANNYHNQRKANKIITFEKHRSDDLLLNILPADVAEELKEKGSANARQFDEVTVLFTDFVNFTIVSEMLSPQQLVDELNVCFKAFDNIMTTHNIEKIKTIGDAYLAVSGLPHAHEHHASNTIKAAQEIQQFMLYRKLEMGDKSFGIRIGIHSGSVVAGIVGVKKFAYDIWGDTVNTAARMEQNSQPGKINVSEKTYEIVKDQFAFTYRGEIEAKNKGAMKMYFVERG